MSGASPDRIEHASTLTGASVDQLAYWRKPTAAHPPLLAPAATKSGRYLYSWADVVALRSIVYLRQEESLPRVRRAVELLRSIEADQWDHLAEYKLVPAKETIIVVLPNGQMMDVERHPATMVEPVLMADVLKPFTTESGRGVPALANPKDHLSVDPDVLGGYPVIVGTRVPFDVVASLADDGYSGAEIVELYPSVEAVAVADAAAFAQVVAAAG